MGAKAVRDNETELGELYLAGEIVPPGRYMQIGTGRLVEVKQEEPLPATLDGRVACYQKIDCAWALVQERVHKPGGHQPR